MKKNKKGILSAMVLIAIAVLAQSCAPVFSDLQSARLVGKGNVEATPSYSTVGFSEEGESEGIQNHVGLQLAYGISSKIDLRLRYEYIWLKEGEDYSKSVIGLGPKFSLLENKIAFYLPVGRALGEETSETWQLHPTLLLTFPAMEDKLDISFSSKYLIAFCEDCDNLVAFNLGLALSKNVKRWAIRPEYGLLFNPGESGRFYHFSIGFSGVIGN